MVEFEVFDDEFKDSEVDVFLQKCNNNIINMDDSTLFKSLNKREWIYRDLACSGADLNRPQFKKMMEDAQAGEFDIIAVWKIDRLSRSLSHLLSTFESLKTY
jgi:DNA invertase Pin-like site-specific DNA recombinase